MECRFGGDVFPGNDHLWEWLYRDALLQWRYRPCRIRPSARLSSAVVRRFRDLVTSDSFSFVDPKFHSSRARSDSSPDGVLSDMDLSRLGRKAAIVSLALTIALHPLRAVAEWHATGIA